ncbi:MAG TPA: hypothetical protein VGM98_14725 [Schlesneria sp.]|jgi:hypothetical protein
MNPDFFGELINGAIPLFGGIYLTLLGFRKTGKQPGVSPSFDEWHRRYGRLLKVIGPALIMFGPGLWLANWARMGPPAGEWQRYSTADGVCSIEFPASPKATNQKARRVTSTGMSLSMQGANTYYALTHSDEFDVDAAQTDEQRLDLIRDNFPSAGHQIGVEYKLLQEHKITLDGLNGREWEFDANKKHSLQMRVFFIGGKCYRAIAAVSLKDRDSEQTRHFLASLRIEKPDGAPAAPIATE